FLVGVKIGRRGFDLDNANLAVAAEREKIGAPSARQRHFAQRGKALLPQQARRAAAQFPRYVARLAHRSPSPPRRSGAAPEIALFPCDAAKATTQPDTDHDDAFSPPCYRAPIRRARAGARRVATRAQGRRPLGL